MTMAGMDVFTEQARGTAHLLTDSLKLSTFPVKIPPPWPATAPVTPTIHR
ncbi:MAG UNVERIFIED_CONTAM: hypothetical protein LVR18_35320 [Planctomycetaceae bacterium]